MPSGRIRQGNTLVQTVVPKALGDWARARAEAEGLSLSAWLRRLVIAAMRAQASAGPIVPLLQAPRARAKARK